MFDVGFTELVLIFVIGLVVLGPERLPKVARTVGRWLGRARQMARSMQYEIERELDMKDLDIKAMIETPTVTPHPTVGGTPPRDDDAEGSDDDDDSVDDQDNFDASLDHSDHGADPAEAQSEDEAPARVEGSRG